MAENIIWTEPLGNISGSTLYHTYDNDSTFKHDGPIVAQYCARMLGYPIVDLEITSGSVYAAFESAVDKYTQLINDFSIINNYSTYEGSSTTTDYTNIYLPHNSIRNTIAISNNYGSAIGIMGNVNYYSASIQLVNGQQKYDLKSLISDTYHSGSEISIHKIYHFRKEVLNEYLVNNATPMWNGLSVMDVAQQLVMPLSYRMIHQQKKELYESLTMSQYSFEIINNVLTLYPIPTEDRLLLIEYFLMNDLSSSNNQYTWTTSSVSGINNVNFNSFAYSSINQPGKSWIRQMTLAYTKQLLGEIRSKYSSIPIPDGEVTLNGDILKADGKELENNLLAELKERLEYLKRENVVARNLTIAQSLNQELEDYTGDILIG